MQLHLTVDNGLKKTSSKLDLPKNNSFTMLVYQPASNGTQCKVLFKLTPLVEKALWRGAGLADDSTSAAFAYNGMGYKHSVYAVHKSSAPYPYSIAIPEQAYNDLYRKFLYSFKDHYFLKAQTQASESITRRKTKLLAKGKSTDKMRVTKKDAAIQEMNNEFLTNRRTSFGRTKTVLFLGKHCGVSIFS